jgi:hypothetical protein
MKVLFDEARAFLYISDNFGGNIDLNPKQALELMDFLLREAETIRGYTLVEEMAEAEQEMQALDTSVDPDGLDKEGQQAWNEYQRPEAIEPVKHWATEWEKHSLLDYRKEEF